MPSYFAYGSCMNEEDLHRTTPEATNPQRALLLDHRIDFTLNAVSRKGGVADIIESPGSQIEGVLWEVPDFSTLDIRESHPYVYSRKDVAVRTTAGEISASTYVVNNKETPVRPSEEYLSLIRNSIAELNEEYMTSLIEYAYSLPEAPQPRPLWRVLSFMDLEFWGENFYSVWEAIEALSRHRKLGNSAQLLHSESGVFYDLNLTTQAAI